MSPDPATDALMLAALDHAELLLGLVAAPVDAPLALELVRATPPFAALLAAAPGDPIGVFWDPDPVDPVAEAFATGTLAHAELGLRRALRLEVLLVPAGLFGGRRLTLLVLRDVTRDRRRAHAEATMQTMLAQAFQVSPVAALIHHEEQGVVMANRRFQAVAGHPLEALRRVGLGVFHADDHAALLARADVAAAGPELLTRLTAADGTEVPVAARVALLDHPELAGFRLLVVEPRAGALAQPLTVRVAGKLRLIGLDDVRCALGARWDQVAQRAMQTAEHVLRRLLLPQEPFARTRDGGFIVCFAGASDEEAAFRSAMIARAIRRRLIGEFTDPAAAAVTAVTDAVALAAAGLPAGGGPPDAGFAERVSARLAERAPAIEAKARTTLEGMAKAVRCVALPVFTIEGVRVPLAIADLPTAQWQRLMVALAAVNPAEASGVEAVTLRLGALAAGFADGSEAGLSGLDPPGATVIVPLEYDAFLTRRSTERCLEALRALPVALRPRLMPLLAAVPEDVSPARLEDLLRLLKPFGKAVAVGLEAPLTHLELAQRFAAIAIVDAARLRAARAEAVRKLRGPGLRLIATGVALAEARSLAAHGVELVSPEARG